MKRQGRALAQSGYGPDAGRRVIGPQFPCPLHGVSDDDAIASIERIFQERSPSRGICAAIVIEPGSGRGWFLCRQPGIHEKAAVELCDLHGICIGGRRGGRRRKGGPVLSFAMEQWRKRPT